MQIAFSRIINKIKGQVFARVNFCEIYFCDAASVNHLILWNLFLRIEVILLQ